MSKPTEPLGVAEVAEALGVKHRTVHQWQHRGIMPARDFTVNGLPAWRRSTIERWARETKRVELVDAVSEE